VQKLRVIFSRCKGLGNFPRGWGHFRRFVCGEFSRAEFQVQVKIFEGGFQLGGRCGQIPRKKENFRRFVCGEFSGAQFQVKIYKCKFLRVVFSWGEGVGRFLG